MALHRPVGTIPCFRLVVGSRGIFCEWSVVGFVTANQCHGLMVTGDTLSPETQQQPGRTNTDIDVSVFGRTTAFVQHRYETVPATSGHRRDTGAGHRIRTARRSQVCDPLRTSRVHRCAPRRFGSHPRNSGRVDSVSSVRLTGFCLIVLQLINATGRMVSPVADMIRTRLTVIIQNGCRITAGSGAWLETC